MHIVTMACTPPRGVRICQLHTWHRGQCIAHHRPEQLNNTKARSAQPSIRMLTPPPGPTFFRKFNNKMSVWLLPNARFQKRYHSALTKCTKWRPMTIHMQAPILWWFFTALSYTWHKGVPYTIPYRRAGSIYKEIAFTQCPLPKGSPIHFLIEGLALFLKRLLLYSAHFQRVALYNSL